MAELTAQEFEALWQEALKGPVVREAAVKPIQVDMSLSTILDHYAAMADGFLAQGKISKVNHDALIAAIVALKAVLAHINEKDLVAEHIANTAKVVQQQVQTQLANLVGAPKR
jgi:hypothetical protein